MKKIMMLIILIIIVMSSCSAEDRLAWELNEVKRKERGYDCGYTKSGDAVCGPTR